MLLLALAAFFCAGLYVGIAIRDWFFDTGDLEQYRPRALLGQAARRVQLSLIEHHVFVARIPAGPLHG